jgi:hypothetical protein
MWYFVFYENDHFRKTSANKVVEADQSGACLRADAQPTSGDYGQKYVSRKHEMWLARAQEHSEEEDRGAGCEPTEQRAAPPRRSRPPCVVGDAIL